MKCNVSRFLFYFGLLGRCPKEQIHHSNKLFMTSTEKETTLIWIFVCSTQGFRNEIDLITVVDILEV